MTTVEHHEYNKTEIQIIDTLCEGLGEQPSSPAYQQIGYILQVWGAVNTIALATQALEIHQGEGMPTIDGSRKRTLGGVFFRLFKEQATKKEHYAYYNLRLTENGTKPLPKKLKKKKTAALVDQQKKPAVSVKTDGLGNSKSTTSRSTVVKPDNVKGATSPSITAKNNRKPVATKR